MIAIDETERATIPQLLGGVVRDLKTLLQQEVALAKAEVRENVAQIQKHLALVAVGAALLAAAALFLLETASRGLTALLAQLLPLDVAVWLAPLLLALAAGGVGAVALRRGATALGHDSLKPEKTLQSLEEDVRWIRRTAK
ncbi:MAG TPA: phage holin family protein [Thermoanaerobaculia bacterium]|nr:phage holin family protein [Thermoanaerobaculia bacterium]